jgi:flagellar hook-length control protein FliK
VIGTFSHLSASVSAEASGGSRKPEMSPVAPTAGNRSFADYLSALKQDRPAAFTPVNQAPGERAVYQPSHDARNAAPDEQRRFAAYRNREAGVEADRRAAERQEADRRAAESREASRRSAENQQAQRERDARAADEAEAKQRETEKQSRAAADKQRAADRKNGGQENGSRESGSKAASDSGDRAGGKAAGKGAAEGSSAEGAAEQAGGQKKASGSADEIQQQEKGAASDGSGVSDAGGKAGEEAASEAAAAEKGGGQSADEAEAAEKKQADGKQAEKEQAAGRQAAREQAAAAQAAEAQHQKAAAEQSREQAVRSASKSDEKQFGSVLRSGDRGPGLKGRQSAAGQESADDMLRGRSAGEAGGRARGEGERSGRLTVVDLRRGGNQTAGKQGADGGRSGLGGGNGSRSGEFARLIQLGGGSGDRSSGVTDQSQTMQFDVRAGGWGGSTSAAAKTADKAANSLFSQLRQQLGDEIVKKSTIMVRNNGSGEIRMNLKPDHLGTVRIQITLEDNHIAGKIFVDNQNVRDAFEQNLQNLQRSFKEHGFEDASLDVSVGQEKRGRQGGGPQEKGQAGRAAQTHAARSMDEQVPSANGSYGDEQIIDLVV